ncbi:hypothetical protein JS756_22445 [Streptomyces actuosus]|uniref:Uncharacterized protein n=1 Tax=Streptomyces actuosus TaxID=1885 RepID=A0ABS2VUV9_STRAS|nr:hypothetical protein [Streptomyces actuosus]MBN0046819.1 hypothetical protein [Streptomyces actuosus]
MSELVEFQMHDGRGGTVGLADLLTLVPGNDWVWSILDFDGIGNVPTGLGFEEFRAEVRASPQGYVMSWGQLRQFAVGVRQCFDLLLVAAEDRSRLAPERWAVDDDFAECLVVFEAVDSGSWEVIVEAGVEEAFGLAAELRARYVAGSWGSA